MASASDPTVWLLVSGTLQVLASSLIGYLILIPMQPWARGLRARWPQPRALMSVHLDMVMLALMQIAAGVAIKAVPGPHQGIAAILLITSGWLNVTPYIWRINGVNAFVMAGSPLQLFAALTSFAGTVALIAGWLVLLSAWL